MNPPASAVLKICLLGEYGVGKTSLANRWVQDQFSDIYRSTLGVRTLACTAVWQSGFRQRCVVWDVMGEPKLSELTRRYLTGAHIGLFLVDGLRRHTLLSALDMAAEANTLFSGAMRQVLVLTKVDQRSDWQIQPDEIAASTAPALPVVLTSSRDSVGFDALATVLGFSIEVPPGAG